MNSPEITIFTAPKPFKDPHVSIIQYNAFRSWKELEPNVSIVIVGDEYGIESVAKELNIPHEPKVQKNELGTPLLSSIFEIGRMQNKSEMLAYINADILIFRDFLESARRIISNKNKFLVVGQRWDIDIDEKIDFSSGWNEEKIQTLKSSGNLHHKAGSDYFIYPRSCFQNIPQFAVGRAGWDNWMIYEARRNNWPCIDATDSINIFHQNHDYSHLPPGKKHYRLPETYENVRLAGGNLTIFNLHDVDYEYSKGNVKKVPMSWKKFWREVEVFPLIKLKQKWLAKIFKTIFHPKNSYYKFRQGKQSRVDRSSDA